MRHASFDFIGGSYFQQRRAIYFGFVTVMQFLKKSLTYSICSPYLNYITFAQLEEFNNFT